MILNTDRFYQPGPDPADVGEYCVGCEWRRLYSGEPSGHAPGCLVALLERATYSVTHYGVDADDEDGGSRMSNRYYGDDLTEVAQRVSRSLWAGGERSVEDHRDASVQMNVVLPSLPVDASTEKVFRTALVGAARQRLAEEDKRDAERRSIGRRREYQKRRASLERQRARLREDVYAADLARLEKT